MYKFLGNLPFKRLGTILEEDQRRTQTNEPEKKNTNDHAEGLTAHRYRCHTMCQENREEEDLPALRTALIHRYNDSKTT